MTALSQLLSTVETVPPTRQEDIPTLKYYELLPVEVLNTNRYLHSKQFIFRMYVSGIIEKCVQEKAFLRVMTTKF